MDDKDIYEISFNLGPAGKEIDDLVTKLSNLENRIIQTFGKLETVVVGSSRQATAQLSLLTAEVEKFVKAGEKGSRRKPIVIVEQKDVQQAKENLGKMGDAVSDLGDKVKDEAQNIADDLKGAFAGQAPSATPSAGGTSPTSPPPSAPPPPIPPVAAGASGDGPSNQAKAAEQAERALINLLAAEFKAAAGADQITRKAIESAAATAKSSRAFTDQVGEIARVGTAQQKLTADQIRYAKDIAITKNRINELNKEIGEQAKAYYESQDAVKQASAALAQARKGEGPAAGKSEEERNRLIAEATARLNALIPAYNAAAAARKKNVDSLNLEISQLEKYDKAQEKAAVESQGVSQKDREQAANQFVRIAKAMSNEGTALNNLAQKYGIFSVVLRKTADASNAVEKEFHDIIRASPQLSQSFDQLIDQVGEFKVNVDPSTFRSAQGFLLDPNDVRQLGFAFQRFGVTGVAAFGEIYAAIGPIGLAIGAVTVAGVTLIKTLVAIGKAGVQAFKDILAASIELASKRQTLGEGFEAYLQDAEAAKAALEEVDRISRDLGVDVSPIAQSFLPSVKSIEELELLARLGQSLALSKPGKQIEDATVAIREFLAGDITSLRKQFEVPGYVLDEAKKISETTGSAIEGLRHISEFLERTGRSAEALSDTFAVSKTRAQEFLNTLGRDLGEDIVASLETGLNELLAMVTDKESVIRGFASGVGEVIGGVLDNLIAIAKNAIETFDEQQLEEYLNTIRELGQAINLLSDSLAGLDYAGGFFSLSDALKEISDTISLISLRMAGAMTVFEVYIRTVGEMIALIIYGFSEVANTLGLVSDEGLAGHLAQIKEMDAKLAGVIQRFRDIEQARLTLQFDLQTGELPQHDTPDASNLDDILAAQYQGDNSLQELREAMEKYLEEIAKLRQDFINKNLDLAIKLTDDILDAEEDLARKREELARKNRDDLIDIADEYEQKVRDAGQDLADDLEDVDIEEGRRKIKQEKDLADKRLEIEEEYRRKLAEIRRKYAFDLQEAARQNDAVAYLRLLRQRGFDINEAKIGRDDALSDVDTDEGKKNDEAAQKRREDEEDARRSNKRKLRDLQTWLDDQHAELRKNYKREKEKLKIEDEDRRKDIAKNYGRDLRDLRLHHEQRIDELNKEYEKEYNLRGEWQKLLLEQYQAFVTQWFSITNSTIGKNAPGGAGGRGLGDEPVQPRGSGGTTTSGGGHNKEWYEDGIVSLARRLGYNEYIINGIQRQFANMSMSSLIAMYNRLATLYANQTSNQTGGAGAGAPSRDSGGHVQANQSVIVGRNGMPEVFTPGSSGYITPISQLYRQPLPAAAQSYAYDQRRMNVDLSLLDTAMLDRSIAELVKLKIRDVMEEAFV